MKLARVAETLAFLLLAVAIHLALWIRLPEATSGNAGDKGDAVLSLHSISGQLDAVVASVDTPPQSSDASVILPDPSTEQVSLNHQVSIGVGLGARSDSVPELNEPKQDTAMTAPLPPAPRVATAAPNALAAPRLPGALDFSAAEPRLKATGPETVLPVPTLPQGLTDPEPDTSVSVAPSSPDVVRSPFAPKQTARAPARPNRQTKPVEASRAIAANTAQAAPPSTASAPARSAQRATGNANAEQAGSSRVKVASLSTAKRNNLMSAWGAKIRSRIERRKPGVTGGKGTVLLSIVVRTDGSVAKLSVLRSSGDPTLDRAALAAVQRAGRFPRAPKALGVGQHRIDLPIRFGR